MRPLIVLVGLVCLVLLYLLFNKVYQNGIIFTVYSLFVNNKVDIGNFLAAYYYNLVVSILEQRDFTYTLPNTLFISKLPSTIPFDQDLFTKLNQLGVTADIFKTTYKYNSFIGFWLVQDKVQQDIGYIMKPLLHRLLDTALRADNLQGSSSPVIHFRCADTPFIRNSHYHFQKYAFFKDALQNTNAPTSITLLSCSSHKSDSQKQESCSTYTDHLEKYLQSIGYTVSVQCNTPEQDFATLFYAPLVISTGSSFSFMSGFFGSGQFISTQHEDDAGLLPMCTNCDTWMYKGYNIRHSMIKDYHDIDTVKQYLVD